jgi:ArsR family transcriptional regulator
VPRKLEPALARRLEVLTGEEAACCVDDLREEARDVRARPAFAAALARAKALSDEKRLLALALLKRRGAMCACEVQAALGLTHATVSHHMGALVEAGLVSCERRGKWAYYDLLADARALVP